LVQVVHIPFQMGGVYPGILLFTQPARMARPVRQLGSQQLELVGTLEQNNMSIKCVRACSMLACCREQLPDSQ
jgi:hypothetical protein